MDKFELRTVCPECESLTTSGKQNPKLYVNPEKGVFKCFHCEYSGMAKDLPEGILEKAVEVITVKDVDKDTLAELIPASANLEAISYVHSRVPNCNLSNIRYSPKNNALAFLAYRNNELVSIKYRSLDPNASFRFWSEPGSQSGYFGVKGIVNKLLLVEGNFDVLAAEAAGFTGDILAMETAGLIGSRSKEILLQGYKDIFIIPDTDEAGQKASEKVCEALNKKPKVLKLEGPYKDFSEAYEANPEAAKSWLIRSTPGHIETITQNGIDLIQPMYDFYSNSENRKGISTGFPSIDSSFAGGFKKAGFTLINGGAKIGKSTFINNLIHAALSAGEPVGLASFEMPPALTTLPMLLSIEFELNVKAESDPQALALINEDARKLPWIKNIHTLNHFGGYNWKALSQWFDYLRLTHSVKLFFVDHALLLLSDVTERAEIEELAKNIAAYMNEHKVHIGLVTHTPKLLKGEKAGMGSSYGGGAWDRHCTAVIGLERSKDKENALEATIPAQRDTLGHAHYSPIYLFYNRETGKLSE